MQIQINADRGIEGHERLADFARETVTDHTGHLAARLTRVEVHLRDENGPKSGSNDKRCTMEARLEHRKPTAVTHYAESVEQAISGAAGKLRRALDRELERLREHR